MSSIVVIASQLCYLYITFNTLQGIKDYDFVFDFMFLVIFYIWSIIKN